MERKYSRPGIKLSIFGKLLIGIIAMIILISLIAYVGIHSINKLEKTSNEMLGESIRHNAIQKLRLNFQQLLMPSNDYLIHGNKVEQSNFEQLLKEVKAQMTECLEFSWNSSDQILIDKFESSLIELEALAWEIFQFDDPIGNPKGAIMMEEMDAIADRAIREIDEYLIAEVKEMEEHIKTTQKTNIKASRTIIIVGLFISFCLVIGGFYYVREITRPLMQLAKTAQKISEGDLSIKAEVNTNDEIEYLAKSFNYMIGVLEKTTVSRDYLNSILDKMVDTLIITDAAGKIIIVNQATLDLLGYQEDEILGQHIGVVMSINGHKNNFLTKSDSIMKLIKNGYNYNIHNIYYTNSGNAIPVSFSSSLMYNNENRISGAICIAYHNTEKCQGEKNSAKVKDEHESLNIKVVGEIPLTKRELEIVKLISEEWSNSEIADKLFISVRTVETHRRNIMQKLHTKSVISLVHYAAQNGII
jgi:PAS domain S-box-containing protein